MSTTASPVSTLPNARLSSLDQFRGYTMLGMMLVNFLGGYAICPRILRHTNDYCSYADTIMPQFFFAAGFAMRLSLGRRFEAGKKMPWGRAVKRILGLAAVAITWYSIEGLTEIIDAFKTKPTAAVWYALFKGHYFQTLLHIAATSLWILPVVTASWRTRVAYAIASGVLHFLISWWFNYAWIFTKPSAIDGGPLGFLTWCIPAICGTLACDAVRSYGWRAATRIALYGCGVMLLGWCISLGSTLYNVHDMPSQADGGAAIATEHVNTPQPAGLNPEKFPPDPVMPSLARLRSWDGTIVEPPFVPPPDITHRKWNYWMMSQTSGNLSYPTFTAGLSLLIYSMFLYVCDGLNLRLGIFRTLGTNSLAAYILDGIAIWLVTSRIPHASASVAWALTGFACTTLFVYVICRLFERLGWYIRV